MHFIPGVFKISELFGRVEKEVRELGGTALIIVDTSAAYFEGEAENDNTQMGAHGRMLRRLTTLPGKPCVITCCHPPKGATSKEAMLPRGGGAFIAEIDGNLICAKKDSIVELHWVGKFRGPDFEPINVPDLDGGTCAKLKDSKGRRIPTVIARQLSEAARTILKPPPEKTKTRC